VLDDDAQLDGADEEDVSESFEASDCIKLAEFPFVLELVETVKSPSERAG
jgi:hypothetical protein